MIPNPKKHCRTPGCEIEINYGWYCIECGKERRRQRAREFKQRWKGLSTYQLNREKDFDTRNEALIIPYIPKPRKIIVSDQEQARIDKEIDSRTNNLHNVPLSESVKGSHREVRWLFE